MLMQTRMRLRCLISFFLVFGVAASVFAQEQPDVQHQVAPWRPSPTYGNPVEDIAPSVGSVENMNRLLSRLESRSLSTFLAQSGLVEAAGAKEAGRYDAAQFRSTWEQKLTQFLSVPYNTFSPSDWQMLKDELRFSSKEGVEIYLRGMLKLFENTLSLDQGNIRYPRMPSDLAPMFDVDKDVAVRTFDGLKIDNSPVVGKIPTVEALGASVAVVDSDGILIPGSQKGSLPPDAEKLILRIWGRYATYKVTPEAQGSVVEEVADIFANRVVRPRALWMDPLTGKVTIEPSSAWSVPYIVSGKGGGYNPVINYMFKGAGSVNQEFYHGIFSLADAISERDVGEGLKAKGQVGLYSGAIITLPFFEVVDGQHLRPMAVLVRMRVGQADNRAMMLSEYMGTKPDLWVDNLLPNDKVLQLVEIARQDTASMLGLTAAGKELSRADFMNMIAHEMGRMAGLGERLEYAKSWSHNQNFLFPFGDVDFEGSSRLGAGSGSATGKLTYYKVLTEITDRLRTLGYYDMSREQRSLRFYEGLDEGRMGVSFTQTIPVPAAKEAAADSRTGLDPLLNPSVMDPDGKPNPYRLVEEVRACKMRVRLVGERIMDFTDAQLRGTLRLILAAVIANALVDTIEGRDRPLSEIVDEVLRGIVSGQFVAFAVTNQLTTTGIDALLKNRMGSTLASSLFRKSALAFVPVTVASFISTQLFSPKYEYLEDGSISTEEKRNRAIVDIFNLSIWEDRETWMSLGLSSLGYGIGELGMTGLVALVPALNSTWGGFIGLGVSLVLMDLGTRLADPLDKSWDNWSVQRAEVNIARKMDEKKDTELVSFDPYGELKGGLLFELQKDRWSYRRNFLDDAAAAASEFNSFLERSNYDLTGLIFTPQHERLSFLRLVFEEDGSLKTNEEISEAYYGNKNWNAVASVVKYLMVYQDDADALYPPEKYPGLSPSERLYVLAYADLLNYTKAYQELEKSLDRLFMEKQGKLDCAYLKSFQDIVNSYAEEISWLEQTHKDAFETFGSSSPVASYLQKRLAWAQEEEGALAKSVAELNTEISEFKASGIKLPKNCGQ